MNEKEMDKKTKRQKDKISKKKHENEMKRKKKWEKIVIFYYNNIELCDRNFLWGRSVTEMTKKLISTGKKNGSNS